jgi:peptidoglycan/xylan/chitin deacetylase (PgdA/CDA1 family)
VALTIDDAPSEYTSEIKQILKANDATATFFVIGSQVSGHEKILEDLVHNGNELGNHAMHDEPSRSLTDAELTHQIKTVKGMIDEVYTSANTKIPPSYFRPGSGFFNRRMRTLLAKLNYQLVLGNIYPHDPQISSWRINARHVLSMLRPGGIIICHDRRGWTAPMLRKVLPEIRRRGYRIVTVTELLKEAET